MASISSLMSSSSSSSIYGNRTNNIISGLASGMDTEAMIEGMVQGYQQKILKLQQNKTKLQWQQTAYQSISDKLVEFSRKYTSYAYSTTNLMSASFFNSAVITTAMGKYADKITANGKSSSDITIDGVSQLATNTKYTVSNSLGATESNGKITITGGNEVTLGEKTTISSMDGSLTLAYGTKSVTIDFGELDTFADASGNLDTEKLQEAINEKLSEEEIVIDGTTYKASECISATVDKDGTITLEDKRESGNNVYISGASGNFAKYVNDLDNAVKYKKSSFSLNTEDVTKEVDTAEYLADKSLSVTLNGQTKQIKLDGIVPNKGESFQDAFERTVNEKLTNAFGAGKITADIKDNKLSFVVNSTDTLSITSSAEELLGMDGAMTSYLDTSKSLEDLLGKDENGKLNGLSPLKAVGTITEKDGNYFDEEGNRVDKDGNRLDNDGKLLYGVTINGVEIGQYTEDTALETIINGINSNAEAGVTVSYSKLTNEYVFTANDSGAGGRIEFGATNEDGSTNLAAALFGGTVDPETATGYVTGKDAVFTATINGKTVELTRSSNTVELDGLTITLEGTFNQLDTSATTASDLGIKGDQLQFTVEGLDSPVTLTGITSETTVAEIESQLQEALGNGYTLQYDPVKKGYQVFRDGTEVAITAVGDDAKAFLSRPSMDADGEGVTFSSKTDTDKVFDAIKQMVTDYNAMVTEIKKAYSDQPLKKADGTKGGGRYEPLTPEDEEGMTESEIKAYEEKAKTGILFMDRDLSSLYSALQGAVTSNGDSAYLRSIGLSTSYEDGLSTITLDETKLRAALENDLDGVRDAFTKSESSGASSDGLMASIQKVTDRYAATTGATKGILIEKAGSKYAPTAALDNTMLDKMEEIDKQISSWQSKMSDKVDYYTNKFTQLELLINQMNSQSAALAGLTGGY